MNEELLPSWVLCAAILFAKMWVNSAVQAIYRLKNQSLVNPEDARVLSKLLGKAISVKSREEEHPMTIKASSCWRNDLENIPMFLFLSIGYVLLGGDTYWGIIYLVLFSCCRIAHTAFYLLGLQPWRNIAYNIGFATTAALAVHAISIAW